MRKCVRKLTVNELETQLNDFDRATRTHALTELVALAKKGPGGVWRIAKNLGRYGLGVGGEHPATPEFWLAALRDAIDDPGQQSARENVWHEPEREREGGKQG